MCTDVKEDAGTGRYKRDEDVIKGGGTHRITHVDRRGRRVNKDVNVGGTAVACEHRRQHNLAAPLISSPGPGRERTYPVGRLQQTLQPLDLFPQFSDQLHICILKNRQHAKTASQKFAKCALRGLIALRRG